MKRLLILALGLSLLPVLGSAQVPVATASQPFTAPVNVSPDQAEALLKANPKTIILDVRTPEEFAAGHIAGAVNISSADASFAEKVASLDRTRPILVHCAAGGRSARVLPKIEGLQFPSVAHLNEGFNGWKAAGKPVVSAPISK